MQSPVQSHRSHWREIVLICRKCTKKVGGGFGPGEERPLRKVLKKALRVKKGRAGTLGLIEVGCFGLCPKGAVTVALGSRPNALQTIAPGTAVPEICAALGLAQPAEDDV